MHHHNTILGQMLQMFPRYEFQKAVSETHTEYHSRGFSSWNHFVAMLFGQLSGQDSLRGIEAGLATQAALLYHAGIKPIHRSTLSYANEHRSNELFKKIFFAMLSKCQAIAPRHKFRFKNALYTLDATIIDLCLSLYDWAKFRTTKGAVKLHVKFNHSGYLPTFMVVTTGKVHETQVAPSIPLERGDVAIFDRAYTDFKWYKSLDDKGVFFVTRLKKNAYYKAVEQKDVTSLKNIYSDQIIELKGFYSKQKFPEKLRRIRSKDPETDKIIVILTNNFTWSAATIAKIYKERWQIELFFKCIKQQLKIKSFVGTSKNALLSQLWVALITYLLLSYLKFKSKFNWSLYTLCSILPTNLFSRRNLWDWLNAPFHEKSSKPKRELQLSFSFG
ncbi:MAG: IS4 family transposase [Candidatus Omnitrophica bacterium CG_4_9_14_0_2_um_filter_43_12]|nr:MAG: IS4 family transposase [Candidatus Nealsonbacteria bacterium CG_4_8_14_3_um_filter_37_23]PJC46004.1 MAG: IS4 family transposase [Candidatus Omnitrophica bacterium CG_4_9_14_0_2_um_filter_43_12]